MKAQNEVLRNEADRERRDMAAYLLTVPPCNCGNCLGCCIKSFLRGAKQFQKAGGA